MYFGNKMTKLPRAVIRTQTAWFSSSLGSVHSFLGKVKQQSGR